jgi:hypothetical protein
MTWSFAITAQIFQYGTMSASNRVGTSQKYPRKLSEVFLGLVLHMVSEV